MENAQQSQKPEPKPEKKPETERIPLRAYLLYAAAIVVGIVIAKVGFDTLTPRFTPARKPAAVTAAAQPRKAVPAPAPAAVAAPQAPSPIDVMKKKMKQVVEPYELNGIYISGDETYALVNNQVAQVGDEVNGAKVVQISEEEVQLSRDNKIIHLQTRNK